MRPDQLTNNSPGRLEPTEFEERNWLSKPFDLKSRVVRGLGYVPEPLPPQMTAAELFAEMWPEIMAASGDLHQLEGTAKKLTNPHVLINPLQALEAQLTARIENTFSSGLDMALYSFDPTVVKDPDTVREVNNYIPALEHGLSSDLPICLRLICEMHDKLLAGVNRPVGAGSFRKTQNAIGMTQRFSEARFVPPPPQYLEQCLRDLEGFINDKALTMPPVVKWALVHYQFETIHPFIDGNGRLGRLLITLLACREGMLSKPLAYLSGFFESNRDEYYDRLLAVSLRGEWREWIAFFLEAISFQAKDAMRRADRLDALRSDLLNRVHAAPKASARLGILIDLLFSKVALTKKLAATTLDCKPQAASNLIERMVSLDILKEATGRASHRIYFCPDILEAIYGDSKK